MWLGIRSGFRPEAEWRVGVGIGSSTDERYEAACVRARQDNLRRILRPFHAAGTEKCDQNHITFRDKVFT